LAQQWNNKHIESKGVVMSNFKAYTATLSQSQGRQGFSVIFRHPAVADASGKLGKRVRRGLGTRDEGEATRLVEELNVLLADPSFWDRATRSSATARYDERVVEIFFGPMTPERLDFKAIRDEVIPLPGSDEGYRRALFIGTTGAGKTTLVRQLMGTGGRYERFPSTSTARTTIADTEIVLSDGPYRAVVTFFPLEEVRDHLEECVVAAILAAHRDAPEAEILARLLTHPEQRFRFSYVLGAGPGVDTEPDEEDDEDQDDTPEEDLGGPEVDQETTNRVLADTVATVIELARQKAAELEQTLDPETAGDQRALAELFEEEMDELVREDERFQRIIDTLLEELEKRFDQIGDGQLHRTRQGWPISWQFESGDRRAFVRDLVRFSSNYAPWFGRLLTPLVNGMRVSGPFQPQWRDERPRLVLVDGEGLGHTIDTAATLSTTLTRQFEEVECILVVDTATQPMQAATIEALKGVITTGAAAKLLICFTHFDQVKGDNLPNAAAKEQHVRASVEGILVALRDEVGPFAERALRQRLERGAFFVGSIQRSLDAEKKSGVRTVTQLTNLVEAIENIVEQPARGVSHPVYDRLNLAMAVRAATENFHRSWDIRLGLTVASGTQKEHWSRIKALTRRLAALRQDEYDNLRPVAELRNQLQRQIYTAIQNPVRWDPDEPDDDEKQTAFDAFAQAVNRGITDLVTRRLWEDKMSKWQEAYGLSGRGSTFVRARVIAEDVYDQAAPVPEPIPSNDRNRFWRDVIDVLVVAAEETGVELE
jgi:hypothetical protein